MTDDVYRCPCGWNRIVLTGQTVEDAKKAHEMTVIHRLAIKERAGK